MEAGFPPEPQDSLLPGCENGADLEGLEGAVGLEFLLPGEKTAFEERFGAEAFGNASKSLQFAQGVERFQQKGVAVVGKGGFVERF